MRLAGELAEIRGADLRFTERETRELLAASGVALSEAEAALLHQRTEGWAAGLRLAALSLAGHPDPGPFIAGFSGSERTVSEYLIVEMLERQPDGVQNLLLRTSLLDRVNGDLADLLTGWPGSERILLSLEDANAFVVSLDPERTWFRYHHLFGDLLRLELRRRLPAEVPALHRRAAECFAGHGHFADAIRHTQAAGDWQDAARLLADHSFRLTMEGQALTVRALLRAFPPGADHPELAVVRAGHGLARGRLNEAATHLEVAEAYAETTPLDRRRRLRIAIAFLKLSLAARRGHLAGVTEQARFLASPVTGPSDEDIALGNDLRAVALGAVRDVLDGTAPVIGYVTVVEAQLLAGPAYRELGDRRAANQAAERALALAEADRLVLPFAMTDSRELLEALPSHETAHAALLADILDVLRDSPVTPAEHSAPPAEELSPGELRVLRYLPTNLSRSEIAGDLSVSVNTVSTQIRSIYAKLGANDRSAAVHRARELGLLANHRNQVTLAHHDGR